MSVEFLTKIDKRTKYSVYGWIRNQEQSLRLTNVPSIVGAICILFYRDDEIFDTVSDNGIKLSNNKKAIVKSGDIMQNNSYGTIVIKSAYDLVYRWDLRIHSGSRVTIGIVSQQAAVDGHFYNNRDYHGVHYLFQSVRSFSIKKQNDYRYQWPKSYVWEAYGDGFGQKDDVVSLCLDLCKAQIKLIINGKDQGVAFHNVIKSKDIEYRLVVSLVNDGDHIEILNYICTNE